MSWNYSEDRAYCDVCKNLIEGDNYGHPDVEEDVCESCYFKRRDEQDEQDELEEELDLLEEEGSDDIWCDYCQSDEHSNDECSNFDDSGD